MAVIASKSVGESIVDLLHFAIQNSVKEIADKEIELAKERIEQKVKQEVGAIAIRVAQWVEIHVQRDRVVIEVKMDEFKK